VERLAAEGSICYQVSSPNNSRSSSKTSSSKADLFAPPSFLSNDWSPEEPAAAVHLFETWIPILPRFLHDNILDQLILPKVNKAVSEWKPRNGGASLQGIVFPWLPFLGDRMEEVLGDAKRRVRGMLKGWKVEERVPEELRKWKDVSWLSILGRVSSRRSALTFSRVRSQVFIANEWDSLILKYILPKLGSTLRDDFKINPRNQILTPLEHVLPWRDVLRPSMLSQLLETEFFPKWLDILYIWLIQPKPNFDEVTQWFVLFSLSASFFVASSQADSLFRFGFAGTPTGNPSSPNPSSPSPASQ